MPTSKVGRRRSRGRPLRMRTMGVAKDRSQSCRDSTSRDALIEEYLPFARRLARRYARTFVPYEDLVQVASLALVKAVDRFEPGRGSSFEAFAVPTILGELKRYFRESTWALHVTRATQERALAVSKAIDLLSNRDGRSPTVRELAGYLELEQEEVLEGMQAAQAYTTTSLEQPRPTDENDGSIVASALGADDERYEQIEAGLAVAAAMSAIPREDRKILRLRFVDEMTQGQIAKQIGISQMQVSRRLRRTLARLRALVSTDRITASEREPAAPPH